ncbi:hypothetical protein DOTSEDRAFT_89101 [Dothistroma septosporum NZE10]|uniref:Glutathione synthetase n=1 Tax=Dothistroma septosporum (strain NZE10 / CBS 128990) TaxID=675120 RepID=M2YMD5_DOTSN|nr:hypothetical protein DOTSEDRAFT_89101 [Dothistroma septosporum NZE10]
MIPNPCPTSNDYSMTLTDDNLERLTSEVKDYQITHGSLLKLVGYEAESTVPARPVNVSLAPTAFPATALRNALDLQPLYNELYMKAASDERWLAEILGPLIQHDEFIAALWGIWLKVKEVGAVQPIVCGIFRSDYMLHSELGYTGLKQVEMNTFSVAGACHGERVAGMHRHLRRVRTVEETFTPGGELSGNDNTQFLVRVLQKAHQVYNDLRITTSRLCILMIVQPSNFNVADERPLEYSLWDNHVPCYRCEWQEILTRTTISPDRTLHFTPRPNGPCLEVSVVYYRAGYQAIEYDEPGTEGRLRLELSRAIQCPDVLTHLTTFKAVQEALTTPGALERFLSPGTAQRVRETFMPMQVLNASTAGLKARARAIRRETARNCVLKPNLEGGGNNVHGEAIVDFLKTVPEEGWGKYVLMKQIETPGEEGCLMMLDGIYQGGVVSELGVLGTCLWERERGSVQVLSSETAGWTFKTKPEDVKEMSVVKGYGCFDSPNLVED